MLLSQVKVSSSSTAAAACTLMALFFPDQDVMRDTAVLEVTQHKYLLFVVLQLVQAFASGERGEAC